MTKNFTPDKMRLYAILMQTAALCAHDKTNTFNIESDFFKLGADDAIYTLEDNILKIESYEDSEPETSFSFSFNFDDIEPTDKCFEEDDDQMFIEFECKSVKMFFYFNL